MKTGQAMEDVMRGMPNGLMRYLFLGFFGIAADAAVISWTGGGDGVSLFQEANWDAAAGTLTGDYIPKGPATTPHDLVISVSGTVGGGNGWTGTLDLGGTGSLTVAGDADHWRMSTTGGSVLKSGTAYFVSGTGAIDFQGSWIDMDVTVGGGVDLAGNLLLQRSIVDAEWMAYHRLTLGAGSTLRVRGNGDVFAQGTIDLQDDASRIEFSGGKSVEEVVAQHLSGSVNDTSTTAAGRILVKGAGAVQGVNVRVFTDEDSGHTVVEAFQRELPQYSSEGPNIIFIIVDDLGYGDLGVLFQNQRAAGLPRHATPKLDRMAAEGMQLRAHYCPAPVCAPSRASLLNGVHQGHASVRDNQFDKALGNNHTLASMLRTAGYKTAAFGKWGLQGAGTAPHWEAHPRQRGFDYFYGYMRHGDGHRHYPKEDGKQVFEDYSEVSSGLDGCYTADLFTARAKKWMTDHLASPDADKPMFLYLAYDTPHAVLQYPSMAYPEGAGLTGGLQWLGTQGNMINTAAGVVDGYVHPEYENATYDHDGNPDTEQVAWPEIFKRWAGGVRRLDNCVGDLLTLLDDLGIAENTLVVFTSDNGVTRESYLSESFLPGFFDSFGPFDGIKRDVWEGGVRMPTLAYWPGSIPTNSISTTPSAFWDWMPTFADLAGYAAPAITDGVSLVPELTAQGKRRDSTIYIEYFQNGSTPSYSEFAPSHRGRRRNQMQVVHLDGYKGVRYNIQSHADPFEIHDVQRDEKELENLATQQKFVTLQQRMKDRVLQLRRPNPTAVRPYDDEAVPGVTRPGAFEEGALHYSIFEGAWPWLPDFQAMEPTTTGRVARVDLSIHPSVDAYGVLYSGYLDIVTEGDYTFHLVSDLGANLRIHDALVIDDDFLHNGAEVSGSIRLEVGKHPFRLSYRHDGGANMLRFLYEGPGIAKQEVPSEVFVLSKTPDNPRVSLKLLDDPRWTLAPPGLNGEGLVDRWDWGNPGITWVTTTANTGEASFSFDAGSVTLTNRFELTSHPAYVAAMARINSISNAWEASDFVYAATNNYDAAHELEAWYQVSLRTADYVYTGTSGTGRLHGGPAEGGSMEEALAAAWNLPLSWDRDPFLGGGMLLAEIQDIRVEFFGSTLAGNVGAAGSTGFTMIDSGIMFGVDLRDGYEAWAETHALPSGMSGDDDEDRVANFLEYAFNLNPTNQDFRILGEGVDLSGLPVWRFPPESEEFGVEFVRRKNDPTLRYTPQFTSSLLQSWSNTLASLEVTAINSAWERVRVVDQPAGSEDSRRFGRVRVERQ